MKKTIINLTLVLIIVMLVTSCAHIQPDTSCLTGKVYGFWNGLWHGMISLFTFIGSLFDHDVTIYAINNNGAWYNLGFLLGISFVSGSSTKVVYRSK